ncbi:TBC1 domain family member 31-like [Gigantopelta aegis]|uniref:TBC1 domain family member 31-like n=1 Tax=Gigantopelta aegis TaxID=1735272 RepID=UPI001B88E535|nr:TBC1 domain family member 31-like [Gigantopelta aegis]
MMQTLDVCKKTSGKIWHRKPSPSSDNGLMFRITSSLSSALSDPGRNIRFLHTAFDAPGDRFIAGDHHGNVYIFDLTKNRFCLAQKTGHPSTALAFTLRRKTEFLVGLSDYSFKCFDSDTKELVAWMKGHESAIHSISMHASGRYVLTTSADTALLWDLDTFQRKRKLNIKEEVGLLKVFFLPLSNTIVTCFRDDTIFAWESDTLECKYQLPVPPGDSPQYRVFAATRDGRILAAGGRSRFIHLWSLDTRRLLRIIELPNKVVSVKQLDFIPDNFQCGADQVLGVLCQDGLMRFINTDTCKLLFDIGTVDNRISNVSVSPSGRHIVAVMDDGNVHVYSVLALSAELSKPPAPLVKVVTSNRMSETVSTESSDRSLIKSAKSRRRDRRKPQDSDSSAANDMDLDKLCNILKGYGEYPAKYRMFIWRSVLHLPENHAAYGALVDKGSHPAYSKLHEVYPIKSRKLLRVLQRILSALAHWSPIFGETQYLPTLAFPFVKLFQNNHLVCFEIIATLLVNWGYHWFEYFPNPPINILAMIENIIAHHDRYLLQHFVKYKVTSQIYAWPLLESVFSEVLTKEEWLMMWDNVFSSHPSFLLMLIAAYAICARGPLMQCKELDDFKYFFHHRNAVDVKQVVKEAYRLMESTPNDIHPKKHIEEFKPLTKGLYPVFNKYPKFIVDYQVQERERIRQEELEYLRQKQVTLAVEKETEKRQQEEEAWYRQEHLLTEAEDKRRRMIQEEEHKLAEQRKRLFAMNREVKLKELQLLDAARRKFLHFQQTQREAELKRLDDEMQRKALMRDQETEAAIEEAEIKNMELNLQKKMFEQELFREYAVSSHHLRSEQDLHRKQKEMEDRIQQRLQTAERERDVQVRKMMSQQLATASQKNIDMWAHREVDHRHHLEDCQREAGHTQLAKIHEQNRTLESEVQKLMTKCQDERESETATGYRDLQDARTDRLNNSVRHLDQIEDEINADLAHVRHIHDDVIDAVQKHRKPYWNSSQQTDLPDQLQTEDSLVNTKVSFERSRQAFEEQELALLNGVRQLRQKIAMENRAKKPPPPLQADGY